MGLDHAKMTTEISRSSPPSDAGQNEKLQRYEYIITLLSRDPRLKVPSKEARDSRGESMRASQEGRTLFPIFLHVNYNDAQPRQKVFRLAWPRRAPE